MKTIKDRAFFCRSLLGAGAVQHAGRAGGVGGRRWVIRRCRSRNHPAIFDVEKAAESQTYCDDISGILAEHKGW